jgi:hypothetical protein
MTILKTLLAASAVSLSLGAVALASESSEIGNPGMLLFQNGSMTTVPANSKAHAMIMGHAKPYTTGAIYASAGRLYIIDNVRMDNGKMLYDLISPGNPNYATAVNR